MTDPSSKEATSEGSAGHKAAAVAIFFSAATWSLAPVIIHETARDSNPFLFNFVAHVTMALILIAFVTLGHQRYLVRNLGVQRTAKHGRPSMSLRAWHPYLLYFKVSRPQEPHGESRASLVSLKRDNIQEFWRMPLFWAVLSSLQVGFLAWSTQYIETAISAVIYELWPLFTVYGLARHERMDRIFRNQNRTATGPRRVLSGQQIFLTGLAAIGVLFMMGSQANEQIGDLGELFTKNSIVGIALALMSSVLAGVSLVASLVYGKALYYYLVQESRSASTRDENTILESGRGGREILLWSTMLGVVIARVLSLPISLSLGLFAGGGGSGFGGRAMLGALFYALAAASSNFLARFGNIGAPGPAVNSIFFVAPVLAVFYLMRAGITLPRIDLYIVGAALVIAVNVIIQSRPDRVRDPSSFGPYSAPGSKLGFTAFVISIWFFGTALYLRDEILPADWLAWTVGDYWGLIALSATVFALILGFRVARLTSRIAKEDELMLNVFRDCEQLVEYGMRPSVLDSLVSLDTARGQPLRNAYNEVHIEIRNSRQEIGDREGRRLLFSVQKQLDILTHNKQQGRDIVELLSLTAFAMVTVGLGILARPGDLGMVSAWSGLLSEIFVLMFVSTIGFLCINLFDIRRERETPLLVNVKSNGLGQVLFFRQETNLTVQYVTAIVLSAAMAAVFGVLLSMKWF